MSDPLVIDANPIISALLSRAARDVLFSDRFTYYCPQFTLFEVAKHVPWLAERLELPELELFRDYQLFPIIACQPDQYEPNLAQATRLIGGRDARDVPVLALTLTLGYPLWTEDRDFDGIPGIVVRRTVDLLAE